MARPRFTWMVSPKSMISLVGAEYQMMKESGSSVLRKFYGSAILIVCIMVISACSIFYGIDILVHNYFVELLLSVFISLLFGFMYIFLMNTFAKGAYSSVKSVAIFSNLTRMAFVIFMAYIISKPIEIWLMHDSMDAEVATYRQELTDQHTKQINKIYNADIVKLTNEKARANSFQMMYASASLAEEINKLDTQISSLNAKRDLAIALTKERINSSDFFIFRVKEASRSWVGWLCCCLVMTLFLLPGLMIYSISENDSYYQRKKNHEVSLIKNEYEAFEKKYRLIFKQKYGVERSYYTVYEDPPFNSIRKKDSTVYQSNDDFFAKYLKGR